MLSRIRYAY